MLSFFTTSFAIFLRPIQPVHSLLRKAHSSKRRVSAAARRIQLGLGLTAVGIGVGVILQAGLGSAAWDVLNLALVKQFGAPIGVVALLVGLAVGGLAVLFGARPNWRSLIPLVVVSPLLDLTVRIVSTPQSLTGQIGMLFFGMVLLALGVGAYIQAGNAAGPSDLLFLQLAKTPLPLWAARVVLDGTVLFLGWSLGGPVGPGTVIVTAGMGPLVALSITWFDLSAARANTTQTPVVSQLPERNTAAPHTFENERVTPIAHNQSLIALAQPMRLGVDLNALTETCCLLQHPTDGPIWPLAMKPTGTPSAVENEKTALRP